RSVTLSYKSRLFFVTSRRRHTISKRDWSSDVCSSDLTVGIGDQTARGRTQGNHGALAVPAYIFAHQFANGPHRQISGSLVQHGKIGRASCRDSVFMKMVVGYVSKKRVKVDETCDDKNT